MLQDQEAHAAEVPTLDPSFSSFYFYFFTHSGLYVRQGVGQLKMIEWAPM
jgi:hypothetical protein